MTEKKILVVDDEASIRSLLRLNLQRAGYAVLEAADGQQAILAAEKEQPALLLLDLMLPGMDGLAVCRHLKEQPATAGIPIIMLTARDEEIDRVLGLEMGADDYVAKPFSVRELMARIKAVLRRSLPQPARDSELRAGSLLLDFSAYTAAAGGQILSLTPKEYELLKLLVTNQGRAFSRDELLEKIWGYEYFGDTRTVDVHIRHLRAKLADADAALLNAIGTVRGVGYRFELPAR